MQTLSKYTESTKPPYVCKHRGCGYTNDTEKGIKFHYQRSHGAAKGSPLLLKARREHKRLSQTPSLNGRNGHGTNGHARINKNGQPRKPWGSNRVPKSKPVSDAPVVETKTPNYCWCCGADQRGVVLALTHLK